MAQNEMDEIVVLDAAMTECVHPATKLKRSKKGGGKRKREKERKGALSLAFLGKWITDCQHTKEKVS